MIRNPLAQLMPALLLIGTMSSAAMAQGPAPMSAGRPSDPGKVSVDAHLAQAPKRKKAPAVHGGKPEAAVRDGAGVPAGRPPLPTLRPRAPKAKR